jgi:type II secretory pathway component PulF
VSTSQVKRIHPAELETFHAHLAMLVESGLPLPEGIRQAAKEARDPQFKEALARVSKRLEEGNTLSEAMAEEKDVFSADYTALIKVGEQSGDLIPALGLALEQEFFHRNLHQRLLRSILYPGLVFVAVSAAYFVLIIVSYPLMLDLLRHTKGAPPAETAGVYHLFTWAQHYGVIIIIALVLILVMFRQQEARRWLHQFWLNLPLLRNVLLPRFLASFSMGMAIALRAGIPMAEALLLVAKITQNLALKSKLETAAGRAAEGAKLTEALAPLEVFPPLYLATLATGEEAGALTDSLSGLAQMYRDETEAKAKIFLQGLDYVLIFGVGAWTGGILVAFYHLYIKLVMSIDSMTIW